MQIALNCFLWLQFKLLLSQMNVSITEKIRNSISNWNCCCHFLWKAEKITETNPRQLFCCCCLSAIIDDNIFVQTFCFWQLFQMKNLHLPFFTLTHKKYKFVPSHRNASSWHKYFFILFLLLTFMDKNIQESLRRIECFFSSNYFQLSEK